MLDAADLTFEANEYYAQKAKWKGATLFPDMKWEEIQLLKAFLSEKDNSLIARNVVGYAWYVNEVTGDATLLNMTFTFDRNVSPTLGIQLALENSISATNGNGKMDAGGLTYKVSGLGSSAMRKVNFKPLSAQRYKARLTKNVSIYAISTAPRKEVKNLLQQLDLETLSKLF